MRKRRLKKKALAFFILSIFLVGCGLFELFDAPSPDALKHDDRLNLKKNIVVMGVDSRDGDEGRSDTLFVVMLDTVNHQTSLLSIPRDTLVQIPRHGWDKANHAYAYGGHKTTQQMVEQFLGIQVNNYILIDFKGFKQVVDAIGGVDINVEKEMHYSDPYDSSGGLKINLHKGMQHLDGEKAMEYVRYRDEEGDIGRIRRQQKFVAAVYDKVTSANILLKVPGLIKQITMMIKTDMDITDMGKLAKAMYNNMQSQGGLSMAMVPGDPVYIDGISYWKPDMTDLRKMMVAMQGGTMSDKYRVAAEKYEAEYDRVVPTKEAESKQDAVTKKAVKIIKGGWSEELQKALEVARKAEPALTTIIIEEEPKAAAPLPPVPKPDTSGAVKAEPLRIKVVNCSGNTAATGQVAAIVRNAGLILVGTTNGSEIGASQIVVANNSRDVINRLSNLSFRYALRVVNDPAADADATIYVGKDFK